MHNIFSFWILYRHQPGIFTHFTRNTHPAAWTTPALTYISFDPTTLIWPFTYLPFFAVIFYPLTLWGLQTFATLFYIGGLICFGVSIILLDHLLKDQEIEWESASAVSHIDGVGYSIHLEFSYNQSKLYVLF